jgi:hypothetical protein
VNTLDIIPVLLLLLFSLAVGAGATMVMLIIYRARRARFVVHPREAAGEGEYCLTRPGASFLLRPTCWLAVKSRKLGAVQTALGLHNPKPCSWIEGLAGDSKLFIAPPVRGWILVMGSGLPEPDEDVDACFRFLAGLSRKLGHIQFFQASPALQHHAWVRAEAGKVVRAYAWAGKTLWKQGKMTTAEKDLDMECADYGEPVTRSSYGQPDRMTTNVDRVHLLAARWSLDPSGIDETLLEHAVGVAGEPGSFRV